MRWLASLALLALVGCTVYQTDGPVAPEERVFVCHEKTRSLRVTDAEARSHLQHGDTLGICQGD